MPDRQPRPKLEDKPDYSVLARGGDPYVYPGPTSEAVLRNKLGLKNAEALRAVEGTATSLRLAELSEHKVKAPNSLDGLKAIHKHIFQDVYHWAGHTRKMNLYKPEEALRGASVPYSRTDEINKDARAAFKTLNARDWSGMNVEEKAQTLSKDIAEVWRVHAFREGNTRTVTMFMDKFTREHTMRLDMALLKENAAYVRRSLVAASMDKPEHLERILKDSLERGAKLKEGPRKTLKLDTDRDRDR